MKRTLFLLIFPLFLAVHALGTDIPAALYLPAQENLLSPGPKITVQYPQENMEVARGAKQIFILGQVALPGPVKLDINGNNVFVYPNGAFLAFLPVQSGPFEFVLTASNTKETIQAVRRIIVPGTDINHFAAKAEFDPEEVFPQKAVELLPGDDVSLYVRGTPGATVTATLSGLKDAKNLLMTEDVFSPGSYRAQYVIDPEQKAKTATITYRMKDGPGGSSAEITAPARLKVLSAKDPFTHGQILTPGVKLRKIPTPRENLYPFYRAYGNVLINGRLNGQYRIMLNEQESAWLEEENFRLEPAKDYEPNTVTAAYMRATDQQTRFTFVGKRMTPISVHEFNDRLELTLYYTDGFDENFSMDNTSPLVKKIIWSKPAKDTLLFKIYFKRKTSPWGHAYDFEENNLVLDLIHKPVLTPAKNKPLTGARILLDAGHSPRRQAPYDGAVGPTGYLEYEANLALAEELKPLLEREGATVIMTRSGNNYMSLQERYKYALRENAHIFVSLHYNALPETTNPFAGARGFSVYYNYPHSFQLAQSVYDAFTKRVPLPGNGLIANDVLFIPRIPQMPSILVENAYIILPQQEEMARSKKGREPLVRALYEGIMKFYGAIPRPPKKTMKKAVLLPGKPPVIVPAKKL